MAAAGGEGLSIQQRLYPDLTCFGCGHANPKGLHLSSYPDGEGVVARFSPWPEHDNGGGFLNGGIIATLLDCHSGAAVMHAAERHGIVPEGGVVPFVTAGLDVRFVRPTPMAGPLEIRARVLDLDETTARVAAELLADGRVRATGEAVWKRWRPRT
jgi:acyl-coenzyme A thioesterase PaaI-like protein